jgi:dihydrofolate synthase/folylpolyglutamate synthase
MNYQETLQFLYAQVPVFEQVGSNAYKPGLQNISALDAYFHHPHRHFRTIHVAGTNGKGSVSHTLAATLQAAGYRVGLFTSPHLLDFSERIRVNGTPIEPDFVVRWTAEHFHNIEHIRPSFFELATMMAFCYFAELKVDVAVIEVGLGGRLDSTNIIIPELCVITNISFDHMQFLGNTLPKIAGEKAGIMKPSVPCVIGEADDEEVRQVFERHAAEVGVPLSWAEEDCEVLSAEPTPQAIRYQTRSFGTIEGELTGDCQVKNTATILRAIQLLRDRFTLSDDAVRSAFASVCERTGLMGRWQKLSESPEIYCDTGHNEACFRYLSAQLRRLIAEGRHLHIVFGMVSDKDIDAVLCQLPAAHYYITAAATKRSLPAVEMQQHMARFGLSGTCYPMVAEAVQAALCTVNTDPKALIFIGGSNFVVAEALAALRR